MVRVQLGQVRGNEASSANPLLINGWEIGAQRLVFGVSVSLLAGALSVKSQCNGQ